MKLNEISNINLTIQQIEAFLLDFEQCPQTNLLQKLINELRVLSQKMRKHFQLKKINNLINELVIICSAAANKEIVLDIYNIELALRIMDLINICCNTEYKDISEIVALSDLIATKYTNDIKEITKDIQLVKKTQYLKFEPISSTNNGAIENVINKKTIINERKINDKKELTDNKDKLSEINAELLNKRVGFDSFDVKELSSLISMLKNTIDIASGNTFTLTTYQLNSINRAARSIKNLASERSVRLIDETSNQLDKIDDFINSLGHFSDFSDDENENISKKDKIILDKKLEYDEINELVKSSIVLNDITNYNDYISENINTFKGIFDKIGGVIDKLKINSHLSAVDYKHIMQIDNEIQSGKHKIEQFNYIISEKLMNAGIYTTSIYKQLSNIRSKPFSAFTTGIIDYVNVISEAMDKNSVNVTIKSKDVLITADLWQIFENIIPAILRYIVVFNIEKENQSPQISIEVNSNTGIIEIWFIDNGTAPETKRQINILRDTVLLVQNLGGKTFINSLQGENKIKFKFQQENILNNYVILENSRQYYAIPTEYYLQSGEEVPSYVVSLNLSTLLDEKHGKHRYHKHHQHIYIKFETKIMKLLIDRVVKVAMLAPQRLTGAFSKNYSIGAAQFGEKAVLLLDVEMIFSKHKATIIND
jgi:hypothetical protein